MNLDVRYDAILHLSDKSEDTCSNLQGHSSLTPIFLHIHAMTFDVLSVESHP